MSAARLEQAERVRPLGARVRNLDWEAKTSGAALYTADVELPNTLTARILRSPHAHARITSIDTSAAERLEGVAAVLTAADLQDVRYVHHGGPLSDRFVLAHDVVRFAGEEVAAVAAETPAVAHEALRRFRVRYRQLPVVESIAAALAPDAPQLHGAGNVALRIERNWGDPTARTRASTRVSAVYRFGRQTHAAMETNSVLAEWDPRSEQLHLWISTQSPYFIRKEVSTALALEFDQVHVHEVAVGGGFGSKSKISEHEIIASALSIKTGRPVRLLLTRDEEFAVTKCRHDFEIELETGVDSAGLLTHRSARIAVDNGAYNHTGPSVMGYGTLVMGSLYRTSGIDLQAELIYTNKHPGGQFRGYGGPQATFAIESQMDELAQELGIDPIDLRTLNANQPGDVTHTGWRLASARLVDCLAAAREAIDWDHKRQLVGSGRGVGLAAAIHVSGANVHPGAAESAAGLDIRSDGSVLVRFGGSDAGTGQKTLLAQMAAAELEIEVERVEVVMMDSDRTPLDAGAWSSRGTYMAGLAVGAACRAAVAKLRETAAMLADVDPGGVTLEDGHLLAGDQRYSLAQLVGLTAEAVDDEGRTVLSVHEDVTADVEPLDMATGMGNISGAYSFAVHAVEVEVDRDSGKVRIVDAVAVHDAGRALNATLLESQIAGGMAMGLGAALGEELIYEGAKLVNGAYIDYPLPRAADLPEIRTIVLDAEDPFAPYGAKGAGEISLVPAPAAVANAVAHAIGFRVRELPITPDKVLAGLAAQRGSRPRSYGIWRRPNRWWIAAVRAAYPHGVHALLHRFGTRLARSSRPTAIATLARPERSAEAARALARNPGAAPIAGGTDLIPARRQGVAAPTELVDVSSIAGLAGVEASPGGQLRIGAGVRLADLLAHPELQELTALRECLAAIATPQIREMATVGGNLCQQQRCWFYRSGLTCYKRGGPTCPCYAVLGDHRFYHAAMDAHRCQAVTPSDLGTVLLALDATATIEGVHGERTIPFAAFYSGPGETAVGRGELLTCVTIPAGPRRASAFEKLGLWDGDFAVASACVSLQLDAHATLSAPRAVIGAIAPTPIRLPDVERRLAGRAPGGLGPLDEIAAAWMHRGHPLARNGWKLDAASGLLRRCLERCLT